MERAGQTFARLKPHPYPQQKVFAAG